LHIQPGSIHLIFLSVDEVVNLMLALVLLGQLSLLISLEPFSNLVKSG